jgi:two-component system sensor histidine kinase YesM
MKFHKIIDKLLTPAHKKILNINFRNKLFLVYMIITIIPSCFYCYYSYATTRKQLTNQIHSNINNSINQINSNVENTLSTYSQISSLLYLDLTLKGYLTADYKNDDNLKYVDAYNYINNNLKRFYTINTNVKLISIYINNPTLISDNLFIKRMDNHMRKQPWYHDAIKSSGRTIYSSTHKIKDISNNTSLVFTLARVMNYDSLNYPYGILTINIEENELYSLIDKENYNKTLFIVNNKGQIMTCKDKNKISKNISNVLHIGNGKFLHSGSFDCIYGGLKNLVAYKSMPNGWKTVALIPYKSFLKETQNTTKNIILFFMFNGCIAIILIYFTSKLITKRLERLVLLLKKVEGGNFDIQPVNMGHDEIGQLATTFDNMTRRLKELINEVYHKEILKKQAELNTLQNQINPHFLYNILSSISALALKEGARSVNDMVLLLSKFYRITLSKGKNIITIKEEIELTKYYISLQQIRFEGLLHIHYMIDDSLGTFKTTKLLLQPFIENCINHAIWDDNTGINIVIKCYEKDASIYFDIIDDGIGMSELKIHGILSSDTQDYANKGYGIKNVINRLNLYFGSQTTINIYSKPGIGTKIQIIIPKTL